MRITTLLKGATIALALAAPLAAPAFAFGPEDYDYARDLWPKIQAQLQADSQKKLAEVKSDTMSDGGFGSSLRRASPGIYDQNDRYVDPATGVTVPGAPSGGA